MAKSSYRNSCPYCWHGTNPARSNKLLSLRQECQACAILPCASDWRGWSLCPTEKSPRSFFKLLSSHHAKFLFMWKSFLCPDRLHFSQWVPLLCRVCQTIWTLSCLYVHAPPISPVPPLSSPSVAMFQLPFQGFPHGTPLSLRATNTPWRPGLRGSPHPSPNKPQATGREGGSEIVLM